MDIARRRVLLCALSGVVRYFVSGRAASPLSCPDLYSGAWNMMPSYQPIEHYGIVGNMRTAALVGMDGSIDWLCLPHFDSPSVFAAVLDAKKGGRFWIAPVGSDFRNKQFYWPDTNILITRFLH